MSAQRSQVREGNFLKLAFIQPQLTKDSSFEFDWLKLTFLSASSMAAFSERKEPNEFKNKMEKSSQRIVSYRLKFKNNVSICFVNQ